MNEQQSAHPQAILPPLTLLQADAWRSRGKVLHHPVGDESSQLEAYFERQGVRLHATQFTRCPDKDIPTYCSGESHTCEYDGYAQDAGSCLLGGKQVADLRDHLNDWLLAIEHPRAQARDYELLQSIVPVLELAAQFVAKVSAEGIRTGYPARKALDRIYAAMERCQRALEPRKSLTNPTSQSQF